MRLESPVVPARASMTSVEHPRPCVSREVRAVVRLFVDRFDDGDLVALDEVFASEPEFRWYSTTAPGERLRTRAPDRRSLVPYLARRHARGELLAVRAFRFTGNSSDGRRPYGDFTFTLTRTTPELGPTRYRGKGAVLCFDARPDTIFVWSMADAT